MSDARSLTLGPNRPRGRTVGGGGNPDLAALRRLTHAARPDLDTFRAILDRYSTTHTLDELRGSITFTAALSRYERLTGGQS